MARPGATLRFVTVVSTICLLTSPTLFGIASAATAPRWVVVGSTALERDRPQATLLENGEVLVAGGTLTWDADTAELYDPATRMFSMTGSMSFPRSCCFTLTPLMDGTVLAAGGYSNFGEQSTSSANAYDPAKGTWAKVQHMSQPRINGAAALLPDGRVLVAGGGWSFGRPVATAEIYDPTTRSWSPTGSMTTPRAIFSLTALRDGRILAAGGFDGSSVLTSAEIYDPATGTWTTTGSMKVDRYGQTDTLLPNGTVLVAGGERGNQRGVTDRAEIYHPATGLWTPAGRMSNPRIFATATLLPDGTVLVAGGADNVVLASADVYDPSTKSWSATASMHTARWQHAAVLLNSNRVLVVGGTDQPAELYVPAAAAGSP